MEQHQAQQTTTTEADVGSSRCAESVSSGTVIDAATGLDVIHLIQSHPPTEMEHSPINPSPSNAPRPKLTIKQRAINA